MEHPFYLNTAEARFIRWDCSDWQPRPAVADADNELASSILETLAANRGKTLYCALDQSDTWTKRQVYDNAHRHNDRDRTQYDGSQGQGRFRGFTAGQAGWLTDGEHGITGVSPERIFEFPQEERRRRRWKTVVVKTLDVTADNSRSLASSWGHAWSSGGAWKVPPLDNIHRGYARRGFRAHGTHFPYSWPDLAKTAAKAYCRSQGYQRAADVAHTPLPAIPASGGIPIATTGRWEYQESATRHPQFDTNPSVRNVRKWEARRLTTWTATCEKTRRVRR